MPFDDVDLQARHAKSLQSGSANEQDKSRHAWLDKFSSHEGVGKGANRPRKSGVYVIGKNDMATRSGLLTLAACMATELGTRSATLEEIREALVFLGDIEGQVWKTKRDHYSRYMCDQNWAVFDEINNALTLTVRGEDEFSDEAFKVAEAYRRSRITAYSDFDSTEADIAEINSQNIPETERLALINARKGQGKFRVDLLKLWNDRCAVTGSATKEAIRASHIKPWKGSSNEERLEPRNGLPLLATLDALFDKGLITFDSDGKMLVSSRVSKTERDLLSLTGQGLTAKPHPKTCEFLSSHFENRFEH